VGGDWSAVWSDGELRSDITVMVARCGAACYGCNNADERGELVHVVGSAHPSKHVVGQVSDVVSLAIVEIKECIHMPPLALERSRTSKEPIV